MSKSFIPDGLVTAYNLCTSSCVLERISRLLVIPNVNAWSIVITLYCLWNNEEEKSLYKYRIQFFPAVFSHLKSVEYLDAKAANTKGLLYSKVYILKFYFLFL